MSPGLFHGRSRLAGCLIVMLLCWSVVACVAAPQGYDDLAGPLKSMAAAAARGEMGTASAAKLGLRTQGSLVQVVVVYRSAAAAAATNLGKFGVRVETRRDRRVQAMVPVDKLSEIAALQQVAQVTTPTRMIPLQGMGPASSQGVQMTQATAMHLAGNFGQGASVAVIDLGFAGLTTAEVPVPGPQAIVNFRSDNNTASTPHGTAVAEIVADMAPQCQMTLIAVDTTMAAERAIDYVMLNGIDVTVMSMGIAEGPFDGQHPLCKAVNRAVESGVFWVNAAGNWQQQHWMGPSVDADRDNIIELNGSTEAIRYDLPPGLFEGYLSWFGGNAQGFASSDYDLVLWDSTERVQIARSAVTQNGDDPPQERLLAYIPAAGQYVLKIERMSGVSDDEFHLFTPGFDIRDTSVIRRLSSLTIPADAVEAYAVGAVRGSTLIADAIALDHMEPYSSIGAAGSGKPELLAPDAVTTSLAGYNPFNGTSAAAPHVAGAAALLITEDPGRPPGALRELFTTVARQYAIDEYRSEPEEYASAYENGRLSLRVGSQGTTDRQDPTIVIEFPVNNSTITVASPRIVAEVIDNGDINWDSLEAYYDGDQVVSGGQPVSGSVASDLQIDYDENVLSFQLTNLTRTRHIVTLRIQDAAGNASDDALTHFRINTPTIAAGLHIVSLPYPDLSTADPSEVFGVPLETMALLRWVPTDARYSKYHIYPDEFAGFAPPDQLVSQPPAGLGYFLSIPTSGTLNITASGLTSPTYDIKLIYGSDPPKGWNLIGNPYENYIDWGTVEFVSENGRQDLREAIDRNNRPVTEGVLFDFVSNAGGGYYDFPVDPTQDTLEPLKGYWLHVLKNATLVVHNAGAVSAAAPQQAKPKTVAPSASNWLLQLEARAGKYEDPINYVGVNSAATDGYDIGVDVSEPPPLVDALRMYMPASQGNLAKDVRAAGGRLSFDIEVACRLKNVPVSISWPRLNGTVPKDVVLRLEDVDTGASVYMRTANGYSFSMAEPGVRRLRVVASSDATPTLVVNGLTTASSRGGQVMFTYSVTREADVSIEIRNIAGTLIRNLGQRAGTPGTAQTALWNGQNDRGVKAPAGRYLARITARAADGQTVQAIRPFEVTR